MANCNDYISADDLKTGKQAILHIEHVAKSRDANGNHALGVTDTIRGESVTNKTLDGLFSDIGFKPVVGSFEKGGVINERWEVLLYESDDSFYQWLGDLPKIVESDSSPFDESGQLITGWVDRTDLTLRSELKQNDGFKLIGRVPDVNTLRTIRGHDGDAVILDSYRKGEGLGGGVLYWDSQKTDNDDGGTVFAVTNVTDGRWVRRYEVLNASMWGLPKTGDSYDELKAIDTLMFTKKISCIFNSGVYGVTGKRNLPLGGNNQNLKAFRDYGGARIVCEGDVTFRTDSPDGADIFQLNCVSNYSIIGYPKLTGTIGSTTGAGSNGVSITNGGENIRVEVIGENLPYTVKPAYVDGGKATTIQNGPNGSLVTRNISIDVKAFHCAWGFEMSLVADRLIDNPQSDINVTVYADDCYTGASVSVNEATSAFPSNGIDIGTTIHAVTKDCQRDFIAIRDYNMHATVNVIQTKVPSSWTPNDTDHVVFRSQGSKNSYFHVSGMKFSPKTLFAIGGISYGASGVNGNAEMCHYDLNVKYQTITNKLEIVTGVGFSVVNCFLESVNLTATDVAPLMAKGNTVRLGRAMQVYDMSSYGTFTHYDPNGNKKFSISTNGELSIARTSSSSPSQNLSGYIQFTDPNTGDKLQIYTYLAP